MFNGIHDIKARDAERNFQLTTVNTEHFDPKAQPIECLQNPWELAQMVELYCERKPLAVLELGPCHGGTTYHWLHNAVPGARIVTIDLFNQDFGQDPNGVVLWNTWVPEGVDFQFLYGDTTDPAVIQQVREQFPDGLDWLFIDANHDYPYCSQDFENYGNLVKPGGVIVLHDLRPRGLGSYRLWEEIRHAGYITQMLVAEPYNQEVSAGIGIVYV